MFFIDIINRYRRYMEAEFESGVSDVLMAFDPEFSYTKGTALNHTWFIPRSLFNY